MNIKDFVSDVKFWIGFIIVIAGIVVGFIKFQQLPERVERVEVKTEVNKDSVEKLSNNVDMFIMEQRTIQREQNKREDLMLKILDKMEK